MHAIGHTYSGLLLLAISLQVTYSSMIYLTPRFPPVLTTFGPPSQVIIIECGSLVLLSFCAARPPGNFSHCVNQFSKLCSLSSVDNWADGVSGFDFAGWGLALWHAGCEH